MSSSKPMNKNSDTGQNRTASWVSSLSATTASEAILGNDNGSTEALNRQQRVRLTTINPITDSFEVPEDSVYVSDLDPGYIEQIFIQPNILQVPTSSRHLDTTRPAHSSPSISELSIDSSIGYNSGRFGLESLSLDQQQTDCTASSGLDSISEEDDNSDQWSLVTEELKAPDICESAAAAVTPGSKSRRFMNKGQQQQQKQKSISTYKRAIQRKTSRRLNSNNSTRRPSLQETIFSSKDKEGSTTSQTPLRGPRKTMGVGRSGTSTLGLNYSNPNIFPIKGKGTTGVQPLRRSTKAATNTSTAPRSLIPKPEILSPTSTTTSTSSVRRSLTTRTQPPPSSRIPDNDKTKSPSGNIKRLQNNKTASTMSRASASNYLNPQLRRRSRSGIFESTPDSSSNSNQTVAGGRGSSAANTAATISGGGTSISAARRRSAIGRPGGIQAAERQYLNRSVNPNRTNSSADDDDPSGAVFASSAAAGVAGRARRMTHQATRLTINPDKARPSAEEVLGINGKRIPLSATGLGGAGGGGRGSYQGRRFLNTPSTANIDNPPLSATASQNHSSSDRDDETEMQMQESSRKSMIAQKQHQPLRAKLETSTGNKNKVPGTGVKPPTWRTQQAIREKNNQQTSSGSSTPHRTPASYTGVAGTKAALRESNSQSALRNGGNKHKEGDTNDKKPQPSATTTTTAAAQTNNRVRPVNSKPSNINHISSSASAIGIGSYNSNYRNSKPVLRTGGGAGVATSVVGGGGGYGMSQTANLTAASQQQGMAMRPPQLPSNNNNYQQRYVPHKGPSSVVSAAPTSKPFITNTAKQQQSQQMMNVQQMAPRSQAPSRHSATIPENSTAAAATTTSGSPVMTPQEAIAKYGHQLSPQERMEILEFPHVYYVGTVRARLPVRSSYSYDDEKGDYIIHIHDHMLYRYELLEVMGKGSFGQVLRAKDHKTGEIVGVKIIRNRKRFHHQAQTEVKLLECLRRWDPTGAHNILQMSASFYFRSHLCIVMELLSMNLYEWLKGHSFSGTPTPLLRVFTVQMLQSLKLMARHRIIHADLKPENILLAHPPPMTPARRAGLSGASGPPPPHPLNNPKLAADIQRGVYKIKVIDLGSSCFETERIYTYIQSRFYRAPEVILGLPYGPGIDMWSLGCIVAELLTGYPLFPGENEREQLSSIVEVLGPPPPYILERAPRRDDFAEPLPYGVQATPSGNMMLLPNGACVVGNHVIKPYSNSKGKRRRPGTRPLVDVLRRANDPRLVDFILRTLAWDPSMRITPEDALCHPWITDMAVLPPQQQMMGVSVPPNVHLGVMQQQQQQQQQQQGFAMIPPGGGYVPRPSLLQQQQQLQPPQAMASRGNYMQQAASGGYNNSNIARTRKV